MKIILRDIEAEQVFIWRQKNKDIQPSDHKIKLNQYLLAGFIDAQAVTHVQVQQSDVMHQAGGEALKYSVAQAAAELLDIGDRHRAIGCEEELTGSYLIRLERYNGIIQRLQ